MNKSLHNYFHNVPQSDEQVKEKVNRDYPSGMAESMIGLYEVRRLQGDSVLEAYEKILIASLPEEFRPK